MGNNEKRNGSSIWTGKGAAITLAVCFVGVIALVGAFTLHDYRNRTQKLAAQDNEKDEDEKEKDKSKAVTTDDIVLPKVTDSSSKDKEDNKDDKDDKETEGTGQNDDAQGDVGEQAPAAAESQVAQVWFDDESTLEWPTSGSVIISYSMDKTVYFSTLDQYKYNPALIIGGNVGEDIKASAPGFVTNVEQNAQTGTTVTLDMGNGYAAIYGQLENVSVEIGDYVNTGDILGYMSEPTKYYSVEGPNLYFEIQKDGVPVNPLDFVE